MRESSRGERREECGRLSKQSRKYRRNPRYQDNSTTLRYRYCVLRENIPWFSGPKASTIPTHSHSQ